MHLTESFATLLDYFRWVFTAPSFASFVTVMTGWLLSPRPRFVTECIQSADATRAKHFSSYHRLFSCAAWCLDHLPEALAKLAARVFAAHGTIHLAVELPQRGPRALPQARAVLVRGRYAL